MKYRYENFGGIISSQNPPFLAFVDRDYMRDIADEESVLWKTRDEDIGLLTAPTEVHFSITNRCSVKCQHCYMGSGSGDQDELDTATLKRALDILSEMSVFHIALGGGDALEREDLFEIADYARSKELVPNLTVSGTGITPSVAEKMRVFGQVNVSFDGIGNDYGVYRGNDLFDIGDAAVKNLIAAGVPTGINAVIGRRNFEMISSLFEYASSRGLNEIEFLRLKPSGRGGLLYNKEKTTYEQNIRLTTLLAGLSAEYSVEAKIDCSFVPMFCYNEPLMEMLEAFATYGCEAGNVLFGIRSNGKISGCSFLKTSDYSVFDLGVNRHHEEGFFEELTLWEKNAPEPCASCNYLSICKGGCHAVAEFVTGDYQSPDPDCPFVIDYNKPESRKSRI